MPDIERAIQFYVDGLNFRVEKRLSPSVVELSGASVPLHILEKDPKTVAVLGSSMTRSYERHWTPVHFDLVIEDIDQAVTQSQQAGAILEGSIHQRSWGRIAFMADPFGHGFCLIQFLGHGYQ